MGQLNRINWQWFVNWVEGKGVDSRVKSKGLPEIESIQIGIQINAIKAKPDAKKKIELPLIGIKVNLYSCIVKNRMGEIKFLSRNDLGSKEVR